MSKRCVTPLSRHVLLNWCFCPLVCEDKQGDKRVIHIYNVWNIGWQKATGGYQLSHRVCGPLFQGFDVFCLNLWYGGGGGFFFVMYGVLPPCYSNINLIFITYQVPRGNPKRVMVVLILQQLAIGFPIASLWNDRYCRRLAGSKGHMYQWVVELWK